MDKLDANENFIRKGEKAMHQIINVLFTNQTYVQHLVAKLVNVMILVKKIKTGRSYW